ncbi:uncharacterized protein LOC135378579 [Ornithodoros turicata]|uniref:uncharacterized protein LOC135378579 n=1 Tax=Ornithodoros turicata TaxID=34597 RepID=UPI0031387BF4
MRLSWIFIAGFVTSIWLETLAFDCQLDISHLNIKYHNVSQPYLVPLYFEVCYFAASQRTAEGLDDYLAVIDVRTASYQSPTQDCTHYHIGFLAAESVCKVGEEYTPEKCQPKEPKLYWWCMTTVVEDYRSKDMRLKSFECMY